MQLKIPPSWTEEQIRVYKEELLRQGERLAWDYVKQWMDDGTQDVQTYISLSE
jgi:hypothetical protein